MSSGSDDPIAVTYLIKTVDEVGEPVELTQKQWDDHILNRHCQPSQLGEIQTCVEKPYSVYESYVEGPCRHVYQRQSVSHSGRFMRIVVERSQGPRYGQIVTAIPGAAEYPQNSAEPQITFLRGTPRHRQSHRGKRRE